MLISLGVHYGSNLDHVERITLEVAREIMKKVPGGMPHFEPVIRYHTFDSSSINLSVTLRITDFEQSFHLRHEFIKRLHKRYAKEGIVIPYPIHAVNYDQEKAAS